MLHRLSALSVWVCPSASVACDPDGAGNGAGAIDECATCVKKSDGFVAPDEGTCAARAMLDVANTASVEVLDDDVGLDSRAARNIVEARESDGAFDSLVALDTVAYVGISAFENLHAFAESTDALAACDSAAVGEFVIVSDLDDTVIPHASPEYSAPPYPGLPALYTILELRGGGGPGDVNYVTARRPERVLDIPAYLEQYGVPPGPIETGISGVPWIAEREKIIDIAAVMARHEGQVVIMFGDDTAADPEAYIASIEAHPDRTAFGLIHEVEATSPASRFDGLHAYENYVEAAAILFAHGVIDDGELETVRQAAADAGLPTTPADVEAWAAEHAP